MAWFSGVFLASFLGVFCSTTWKTCHQNPPIDWGVGEGGRYACGLAWLIFTTAIVFWWFLQTYLTSGQCSCWFLLVMKQRIFWHYLGFQVMAILCWAAKNSLRGTIILLFKAIDLLLRNNLLTMTILFKTHLYHFPPSVVNICQCFSLTGVAQGKIRPKTTDPVDRDVSNLPRSLKTGTLASTRWTKQGIGRNYRWMRQIPKVSISSCLVPSQVPILAWNSLVTTDHRVDRVLSFSPVVRIGTTSPPHPPPQVWSPILWFGGGGG